MELPFTTEEFLEVFKVYNQAIFPIQVLLYAMAFTAIYFVVKHTAYTGKVISLVLALFWFWMGIVYHLIYFSVINKAAWIFGGLFIIQAIIFLLKGFFKNSLHFKFRPDVYGITGAVIIFFALIIYPVLGYFNGHTYPGSPTFGLPCPTTIFTIGLLCWTDKKPSPVVWAIPVLWSVIGFTAAFLLGIKEDSGLFIAGILFVVVLVSKKKKNLFTQ